MNDRLLVIQNSLAPHTEHWSQLDDGLIYVTSFCPHNYPSASVAEFYRGDAIENLSKLLSEGWEIVFNTLFEDDEL